VGGTWKAEADCEWVVPTCLLVNKYSYIVLTSPYNLGSTWTIECWILTPLPVASMNILVADLEYNFPIAVYDGELAVLLTSSTIEGY